MSNERSPYPPGYGAPPTYGPPHYPPQYSAHNPYQIPYPGRYPVPPRKRGRTGRTILATLLLLLGCLLLPLGIASVWLHTAIMDEDGYVSTVKPLARDPAIQAAVADTITEQLTAGLDVGGLLGDSLLDELPFIGAPISGGLATLVKKGAEQLVATEFFATVWTTANRSLHPSIVALVRGEEGSLQIGQDGVLVMDLGELAGRVLKRVQDSGLPLPPMLKPAAGSGRIPLFHVRYLVEGRAVAQVLDSLWVVLPILALLLLTGAMLSAPHRTRWVAVTGGAIVVTMGLTQLGLLLARDLYLKAADEAGLPWDTSAAFWQVTTRTMVTAGFVILAVGVAMIIVGIVAVLVAGERQRRHPAGGGGYPGYPTHPGHPGYPGYPPGQSGGPISRSARP